MATGTVALVFEVLDANLPVDEDEISEEIVERWVYGPGSGLGGIEWDRQRREVTVITVSPRVPLSRLDEMGNVIGGAIQTATGGDVSEPVVSVGGGEIPVRPLSDLPEGVRDFIEDSPLPVPSELEDRGG